MDTKEMNLKRKIILARKSIRQKYNVLKTNKFNREKDFAVTYKPLIEPLSEIVKNIDVDKKHEVKPEPLKKEENEPERDKDINNKLKLFIKRKSLMVDQRRNPVSPLAQLPYFKQNPPTTLHPPPSLMQRSLISPSFLESTFIGSMESSSKKCKLSLKKKLCSQEKQQQGPQILQNLLVQAPVQHQQLPEKEIPIISIRDSDIDENLSCFFENITPTITVAASPSMLRHGGKDLKLLDVPSQGQQLPAKPLLASRSSDDLHQFRVQNIPWFEQILAIAKSDVQHQENRVTEITAQLVEANSILFIFLRSKYLCFHCFNVC
ncbi:hypothetical protein FQR65_LT18440 [Abscondita terminalis]|nr:hypothetical protein FQR65_LT18440 [Abscondita terminalis]